MSEEAEIPAIALKSVNQFKSQYRSIQLNVRQLFHCLLSEDVSLLINIIIYYSFSQYTWYVNCNVVEDQDGFLNQWSAIFPKLQSKSAYD